MLSYVKYSSDVPMLRDQYYPFKVVYLCGLHLLTTNITLLKF